MMIKRLCAIILLGILSSLGWLPQLSQAMPQPMPPLMITPNGPQFVTVNGTINLSAKAGPDLIAANWSAPAGSFSPATDTPTTTYTAPAIAGPVTISAVASGDSTQTDSKMITVVAAPLITSFVANPIAIPTGGQANLTAVFSGERNGGARIDNGVGPVTSGVPVVVAPTVTTTYQLSVENRAGDVAVAQVTVYVNSTITAVAVVPSDVNMAVGAAQVFSANVTGTGVFSNAVTWSVVEAGGGTVDAAGNYLAPALPGIYHVRATSVQDPGKFGLATVTVIAPPVGLSYPASPAVFNIGTPVSMTPTIGGGPVTTWMITPSLPLNLSFDPVTGVISGVPTASQGSTLYTVKASNIAGFASSDIFIAVLDAPPVISYPPGNFVYTSGGAVETITPMNTGGSATNWSISPEPASGWLSIDATTGVITVNPVAAIGQATYTVKAINGGGTGEANLTITIAKGNQTINFGEQEGKSIVTPPFPLNPLATASSGLTVSYVSLTPLICTFSNSKVTPRAIGMCTIEASQPGNAKYSPAPKVKQYISITLKRNQTITFAAQEGKSIVSAPFPLNPPATASSGLPVSYASITPSICKFWDGTVMPMAIGTCTIAANQPGNEEYDAAPQVTQNIVIAPKRDQTITFGAQAEKSIVTAPFPLSPLARASSGLPVSYTSITPSICQFLDGKVTPRAIGTCTIAAKQLGNAEYYAAPQVTQNISIAPKRDQTITFGAQAGKSIVTAPFPLHPLARASSGLLVSYASTTPLICQFLDGKVTPLAIGTCIIAANQSGNAEYHPAPQVTQNISITLKRNQTITFRTQAGKIIGTAPFPLNPLAMASSGLPVSYASTTPTICQFLDGKVTPLAIGTCTIAANQPGNEEYHAAPQVTQNIAITPKRNQTISFSAQAGQSILTASFPLNPLATASSGLPVSYASTTPTICRFLNGQVIPRAIGTCTIAANQPGNAEYNPAPQVTGNIYITPKKNQTITFASQEVKAIGTAPFPLSPRAMASSGLPVQYASLTPTICTYSDREVTIRAIGTCTIAANQPGNTEYYPAPQVKRNILITPPKKNQTITFPAQAGQTFGTVPFPLYPLATASSGLSVRYASITPLICTFLDGKVMMKAVGTCTITANQFGNDYYYAALEVKQNILIRLPSRLSTSLNHNSNLTILNSFGETHTIADDPTFTPLATVDDCEKDSVIRRTIKSFFIDFQGNYDTFELTGPSKPREIIDTEITEYLCGGETRVIPRSNAIFGTWVLTLTSDGETTVHTFTKPESE